MAMFNFAAVLDHNVARNPEKNVIIQNAGQSSNGDCLKRQLPRAWCVPGRGRRAACPHSRHAVIA
jgi:hypothetical protein